MNESPRTIKEYVLFKLDRNLAIIGLIVIAVLSVLRQDISEGAAKIVASVITAMGMYLGIRLGNK